MPGETSYDSGYNYADQINWGKSDLSAPLPQIRDRPTMAPITPLPDNPSAEQLAKFDKENLAANTNRIQGRQQMLDELTRPGPVGYQQTYLVNPYNPLEKLGFNLNNTTPSSYVSRPMNTWGQNPGQNTPAPGGSTQPAPYTQPAYNTPQAPAQPATRPTFDPATNPYWGTRMANQAANPTTSTSNIIGNTNAPQAATPGGTPTANPGIYVDNNGNYQFSNTAGGTSPSVAAPAVSSAPDPYDVVARRQALRDGTAPTTTTSAPTTQPVQPTITQGSQTSSPEITAWNNEFMRLNNIPSTKATNDAAMMEYYKTIAKNGIYKLPGSNFGLAEGGVVGYAEGGSVGGIADIAAQGRNGDSMLVHMTPEEVSGLASLASANGRPLTTNPTTGLPEAFNLKNWLVPAAMIGAGLLLPGAGTAAAGAALGGTGAAAGAGAAAAGAGSLSAGMAMGASAVTGAGAAGALGGAAATGAGAAGALGGAAATGSGIAGLGSTIGSAMASPLAQAGVPAAIRYAQTGDLGQAAAAGAMGWGTGQLMGNLAGTGADAAATAAAPAANPIAMPIPPSVAAPPPIPDMAEAMGASTLTSPPPMPDAYGAMSAPTPAYTPPPPDTSMMGRISDIGGGIKQAVSSQDALGQFAQDNKIGGMALLGGAAASKGLAQDQRLREENDAKKAKSEAERKRVERRIASTYAAQGRAQPHFTRTFAEGGITSQVDGRFLRGEGDGMSDSIPALLNGDQDAALADGEFVIPADVVSNLGNGSSEAGAEQLYAMMDRIRQARTGSTKQAKAIAPKRMLPA